MQTDIAEVIYKKTKILPLESQREVLNFIDNIQTKLKENGKPDEAGLKTLWNEIDEIIARVPIEAWDDVPADGSVNHDHYLYGAPKKY